MAYQWAITAIPANVLEGGKIDLKTVLFDGIEEVEITDGQINGQTFSFTYSITNDEGTEIQQSVEGNELYELHTSGLVAGTYKAQVTITEVNSSNSNGPINLPNVDVNTKFSVVAGQVKAAVTLQRSGSFSTSDQALWVAIRNRTAAIDFNRFDKFIQQVFCDQTHPHPLADRLNQASSRVDYAFQSGALNFHGPYAYAVLKLAAQVFLTLESGVVIKDDDGLFNEEQERIRLDDPLLTRESIKNRLTEYLNFDNQAALPYLDRIVNAIFRSNQDSKTEVLPYCDGILKRRMTSPSMLELIWSYWQEQGMLVQTMNAITLRFQNMRSSAHDPLGELEIDPLRPLNNMLWGYIQDEKNRLTLPRRAYEYDHHYGLKLIGKAVPNFDSADSRSKFIEAFHNLLYRTATFYREDADTTVIANAFPLLNALREVHLLLAEGAHNQFGDLPWTARAEMLIMQWLLSRSEMREFLRGRHMVPYQEPWMGAVDCMKKLQGWTDTTVTHFHELAVTGERIVLSIRYGDWSNIDNIEEQAKNWARYWKPEIQRYIHGYQTATGVDLMADVTDSRDASQRLLQPSVLLMQRLSEHSMYGRIPSISRDAGALTSGGGDLSRLPQATRGRLLK